MGSNSEKAAGLANEAIGNVKQVVGKVVGSEKMQAEGVAQELKGEGQQIMGKTKAALKAGVKTTDTFDKNP